MEVKQEVIDDEYFPPYEIINNEQQDNQTNNLTKIEFVPIKRENSCDNSQFDYLQETCTKPESKIDKKIVDKTYKKSQIKDSQSASTRFQMEWTNQKVIDLINLYRARPVLWDCRSKDYKDRKKKMDALLDIAASLGVEKEEVERKIKNLVCHFLREIKKEKDAINSGAGGDDAYKSKWFCYSSMLFLKDRNQSRGITDTHTQDKHTPNENVEVAQEEAENIDQEPLEESVVASESCQKGTKKKLSNPPFARKKHKSSATEEALSIMRDIQVRNASKDQYTSFGDQVGMRIRDLPSLNAKKTVKLLISNILFEAEMGKYDNPNSANTTYLYNIPNLTHSPFSSPVVQCSDTSHSQQPSYSGRMPTSIQRSLLSPTLSSSCERSDTDSMDSILMEL